MEVELFEGIEADPSVETVMRGAEAMLKFQPDWIVAMGGGSPIDAAKAMWIKYEYPDITFEDMCKVFGIPKLRKKAKFCAIPSTSGTATEVTAFSIITDYQKGIKYPIADFEITPDIAIVDPDLAETMPKKLVAHTGMDAMTHAIEAYVSTANCDFTDPLAIHAIEMIQKELIPSYNGDMEARDKMHNAQCLAGQAFSNALLGIVHSMAHKTGAAFADYGAHIIHGAANAMYLPKVIAYNAKDETAKKRYGVIADYMHLGGANDDEKVALLIEHLRGMNDALNIPHCIKNYGADSYPCEQGFVPEDVFLARLPEERDRRRLHGFQPPYPHSGRDGKAPQVLLLRHRGRLLSFSVNAMSPAASAAGLFSYVARREVFAARSEATWIHEAGHDVQNCLRDALFPLCYLYLVPDRLCGELRKTSFAMVRDTDHETEKAGRRLKARTDERLRGAKRHPFFQKKYGKSPKKC